MLCIVKYSQSPETIAGLSKYLILSAYLLILCWVILPKNKRHLPSCKQVEVINCIAGCVSTVGLQFLYLQKPLQRRKFIISTIVNTSSPFLP